MKDSIEMGNKEVTEYSNLMEKRFESKLLDNDNVKLAGKTISREGYSYLYIKKFMQAN